MQAFFLNSLCFFKKLNDYVLLSHHKFEIMYPINYFLFLLVALVPIVLGYAWYHPNIFGKIWQSEAKIVQEHISNFGIKQFILLYILSFLFAFSLQFSVIHQYHIISILSEEVGFVDQTGAAYKDYIYFFDKYGSSFRTFKHGFLHGFLHGLFICMSIIGVISIFERKSWKYVLIHSGFWIFVSAIMGGLICQFNG